MKSRVFIHTLLLLFMFTNAYSQSEIEFETAVTVESIEQLSFMIGDWEGDGWIMRGQEREEFSQTESIKPKVNNQVLVIEGLGLAKEETGITDRVVHDAFGFISRDMESGSILMTTFATTGGKTESTIYLIGENKIQWQFKADNGGTVRFTEDFSKTNEWHAVGEFSFSNDNWFQFFEMNLSKN